MARVARSNVWGLASASVAAVSLILGGAARLLRSL